MPLKPMACYHFERQSKGTASPKGKAPRALREVPAGWRPWTMPNRNPLQIRPADSASLPEFQCRFWGTLRVCTRRVSERRAWTRLIMQKIARSLSACDLWTVNPNLNFHVALGEGVPERRVGPVHALLGGFLPTRPFALRKSASLEELACAHESFIVLASAFSQFHSQYHQEICSQK